ncbi:MAG: class I SAM-dependent methyltransferase [Candidatus Micrarchaeia archaeon]|jgi:hypothetical protein
MDTKEKTITGEKEYIKEFYFENYDTLPRFISYFNQIFFTKQLEGVKKILEIGIGNKLVFDYLKREGFDIKSCDFNRNLYPDILADIRELPLKENSFDLILACEILEHIPWFDVDKALSELSRVSKKYVIIAIPFSTIYLSFNIKFPRLEKIFKKSFLGFCVYLPLFKKSPNTKEHYWEMGLRDYPKSKVLSTIKKHFIILEEYRNSLNPYHYFFILEKKVQQ